MTFGWKEDDVMTTPPSARCSTVMTIEPAWIDYNGHLNMAYYNVLFDRALDELLLETGLGPDYVRDQHCSYMCVEVHICYLREIFASDPVVVTLRILDVDAKRLHTYCELRHAADDWVAATSEAMFLHTDMRARRTVNWPDDIRARLAALAAADRPLPPPSRAGRAIGMRRSG
jgi:acyl-CoA thioester hydrolase